MGEIDAPAWGALAVEQYLLVSCALSRPRLKYKADKAIEQNNWDASSTENPAQQRQRLIRDYLDLEEVPIEWLGDTCLLEGTPSRRVPTADEIDVILRPYRSDTLRRIASYIHERSHRRFPIFLRTYYSVEEDTRTKHDEMMHQWGSVGEFEYKASWASLNDGTLFNFGPEWRRVFDIFPEIAGPNGIGALTERVQKRALDDDILVRFRSYLKEHLRRAKQSDPTGWRENPEAFIEQAATSMHQVLTSSYLVIADEEAFRSGRLAVVFLDAYRNIIRQARFDTAEYDIDYIISGVSFTVEFGVDTTVGEKYRVQGELGKLLYQLDNDDLADL